MATPGQSIELNDFKSLVLAGATEDPEAIVELAKRYSSKLMSYAESLGTADPGQATQVALITALKAVDVTKPPSENRFEAEMFRAVRLGSPIEQNGSNGRTDSGGGSGRNDDNARPPTIQAAGPIEVSAPSAASNEPARVEPTPPPTIDPELLPPDFDPDLPPNPVESAEPAPASTTNLVPGAGGQTPAPADTPPVDQAPLNHEPVDAPPSTVPEPPRPPEPPSRAVEPDPTITADPIDDSFQPWTAPPDAEMGDEPAPVPPATTADPTTDAPTSDAPTSDVLTSDVLTSDALTSDVPTADGPAGNERVIANDLAVDDGTDELDRAGLWSAAVPGPPGPIALHTDTATTDEHPLTPALPVFDQPTDPRPPSIDPTVDPGFGGVAEPPAEQFNEQFDQEFNEQPVEQYATQLDERFEERPPEGLGVFDMPVAGAPDLTIGGDAPTLGSDLLDTARYDAVPEEAADQALPNPASSPEERPTSYAVTPPVVDIQTLGHDLPGLETGLDQGYETGYEPGYETEYDPDLGPYELMPVYEHDLDPGLDPAGPPEAGIPSEAGTIDDLPLDPDAEVVVERRQPYVERRAPRERSRSDAPRGGRRERTEARYSRGEEDIGADPDAADNGRLKLLLLAAGPALLVIGLTVYLVTIQSDSLATRAPVPADGNLTATTTEPDEAGERATFRSSGPSTTDASATTEPGDATEPNVATSVTVTVTEQGGATGGDFSGETLTNVDLAGTDLAGANFSGSSLTNVDLSDADLTSTDFTDAVLTDVNFERADISGADFTGATQIRSPVNGRWNPNDPPTLP